VWHVEGAPLDVADLPAPTLPWCEAKAPVADVGPLEDLPPADAGIVAALGPQDAHAGHRWHLLGALGGVMRRAGYSRQQAEAVAREWLADADGDVDVEHGIRHLVGAWTKEAHEVSGVEVLAELVGARHAAVIDHAVDTSSTWGKAAARVKAAQQPWAHAVGADEGDALGTRHWLGDPRPPLEYYCEGLRLAPSEGKISLIAGLPGAGKGPIANYLAVCFALGLPAFGRFPCRKSRVLLLDCEGWMLTLDRIERIEAGLGYGANAARDMLEVRDIAARGTPLLSDATFYAIQAAAPEVVILDSYTSAMMATGLDPNKIEFAQLAQLLGGLGVLVISVAHANKAPLANERPTLQQVSGSGALASQAQTGISVWHPDDANRDRIALACMRAPFDGFESLEVDFSGKKGEPLKLEVVDAAAENAADKAASDAEAGRLTVLAGRLLAWWRKPEHAGFSYTTNAIDDASELHHRDLGKILPALERAGIVGFSADGKGAKGRWTLNGGAPAAVTLKVEGGLVDVVAAPVGRTGVAGFRRGE
jgi:hypothetical protein